MDLLKSQLPEQIFDISPYFFKYQNKGANKSKGRFWISNFLKRKEKLGQYHSLS